MEVVLSILAILTVIIIVRGVVMVQQAEAIVIERLGRFNRVIYSGIHIIIPFIESIRTLEWRFQHQDIDGKLIVTTQHLTRIDLREKILDFDKQHVITKDNVSLSIDALIYFQITDPKHALYEVYNLPQAIEKLTQTTLRNVVGGMELDECLVSRHKINTELRDVLIEAGNRWGLRVIRVEIQDIKPPDELRSAMEKQMRAERDRRAMILEAEGQKRSAILSAEGQKESEITAAEGEKQAQVLRAEGEALARIRVAEAEAKAIETIRNTIGDQENATGYLIAVKYIDALKNIATGNESKVVFLPYESSSVLGALGSMKELLTHTKDNPIKQQILSDKGGKS
ncbi:MAG: SPFH/Band 7/PHB domain protein [Candidatus Brocadiae bacterium]|nr:SPFH/Band 7/PHB domain protein [Candidatus Brocadiia bacterium]